MPAYRAHKQEIDAAISRALDLGWYILGQEGRAFETEFAAWLGAGTVVGCGNGTDAIALALRGLGIGAGSTVVTVSHTAVATVAAIESTGAAPLLIDVEPAHYTMDPAELAQVLADPPAGLPPVRAVIPVHLYGQVADVEVIGSLCRRHGVALIEDCAQAHGAKRKRGRRRAAYRLAMLPRSASIPPKTWVPSATVALRWRAIQPSPDRIATLRQYGWARHYISDEVGINSRLDELQAAALRVKLGVSGRSQRATARDRAAGDRRRPRCPSAAPPAGVGARLPPVCRSHTGSGSDAGDVAGEGGWIGYPLSGAGPLAARLCQSGARASPAA